MSLNTAHTDGGVLIHQGEMILLHAPQAVLSFSGSDDLKKYGEKQGNAYLTSHRLIFLVKNNSQGFKSFSFPFVVLSEVDVEQPMFGANCLRGKVRAQPDGGWMGEAKFKMTFKAGGAIEFATGMMRAIQLAKQSAQGAWNWNAPPPAYMDVMGGNAMPAPPMYYNQPANYYGWAPPAYNFPPPEAGTVYVSEAPPPYPGLGGYSQQPTGYMPVPQQPPPPYSQNPGSGYPPQQPYPNAGYPYPQQQPYPGSAPEYSPQQPYPNSAPAYPQPQQYPNAPAAPNAAGFYPPAYPSGPSAPSSGMGLPSGNNIGGGGGGGGVGGSFDSNSTGGGGNSNGGFYPPPQSGGFAYANANGGGQAYVPASAPPPYAPPPMMNKKNQ